MIPKTLFALDLGTTKFCLARLRHDSGEILPFIETVSVESGGMHRGMLSDMKSAGVALNKLLDLAEEDFSSDIAKVVVGVAGSHLCGRLVTGKMKIGRSTVDDKLVQELRDNTILDFSSESKEILHCVPCSFRIDDREWIDSAVGFSGNYLHAQFFLIEADKHYLGDIVHLCNQAGLSVSKLVAEPYASASVTSNVEAKKVGIAIADIGGGTTDGIVFKGEKPVGAFTINIGGKLMTKDLAIGLGIPYEEAERVKLQFGLKCHDNDSYVDVINISDENVRISWREVYPILAPRIAELAQHLTDNLREFEGELGAGILLTGGGSEVLGMCPFMTDRLAFATRKMRPRIPPSLGNNKSSQNKISNEQGKKLASKYATVAGLLYIEIQRLSEEKQSKWDHWSGHYFGQFVNWLRELS